MGSTADLRIGAIIKFNGENCIVTDIQHVKPGKGGAFYQVKMKSMDKGRVLENRFRSGESLELVRVERKNYQYLYSDGDNLVFMDPESYDQIPIEKEKVGTAIKFLKENQECSIAFEKEKILSVELPAHVNLRIEFTEPGFKGDTASSNVMKPATLETGAEVQVPLFINIDDVIRVDTQEGSYIERVKS